MGYIYYSLGSYIYLDSEGLQYRITRDTLIFTFMVYGYLRCPLNKRPMTTDEIVSLLKISDVYDQELAKIVRRYYSNYCDLSTRTEQLKSFNIPVNDLKTAFMYLLTIGLIYIGWLDINGQVPTRVENDLDIIHIHLKSLPYYQSLLSMPCYEKVKTIGIYGNFCHSGYTIENVFKEIENPDLIDISRHGLELISTAAYYLKVYFNYSKPEIDQLLRQEGF